jgi:predicted dehydrogenase
MPQKISRRRLLQSATAAAVAVPWVVPSSVFGADVPSNTILAAGIGVGRMGKWDIENCLLRGLTRNVRVVAVCDVDSLRAAKHRDKLIGIYEEELREKREIKTYSDFREVLGRSDIDVVTVGVPDHSHALVAVAAAKAGKDIHVQKPLTNSIVDGRKLVKAVRDNSVVLQVGSQQRSDARFRLACELIRDGVLGKLSTIEVVVPSDSGTADAAPGAVPKTLNYDMWLGPAPLAPYCEARVHSQSEYGRPGWLQIEPYCRGMVTGWGSHMYDIAQWALGCDKDGGPVDVMAIAEFPDRGLYNVHTGYIAEANYANGVKMISHDGSPGVKFIGENGWIWVDRRKLTSAPSNLVENRLGTQLPDCHEQHMANFLDCVRSREDPIAPVEAAHRSNSVCVIHHIAMKLGRRLHWDPEKEKFVRREHMNRRMTDVGEDDEANKMLDYEHREPYLT